MQSVYREEDQGETAKGKEGGREREGDALGEKPKRLTKYEEILPSCRGERV